MYIRKKVNQFSLVGTSILHLGLTKMKNKETVHTDFLESYVSNTVLVSEAAMTQGFYIFLVLQDTDTRTPTHLKLKIICASMYYRNFSQRLFLFWSRSRIFSLSMLSLASRVQSGPGWRADHFRIKAHPGE